MRLLTLSGGCFVGGSNEWDQPQNEALAMKLGFPVEPIPEWDKAKLSRALHSIRAYLLEQFETMGACRRSCSILGRSSGGYLAKVLFDEGWFYKAVYVAPVFDPMQRGAQVPHLGERARRYFKGEKVPNTDSFDPTRELLLLATEDANIPKSLFTVEQMRFAHYPGPHKGHVELINTLDEGMIGTIVSFLHQPAKVY